MLTSMDLGIEVKDIYNQTWHKGCGLKTDSMRLGNAHLSNVYDWLSTRGLSQLFQTVKASDNSYATVEQGEELLI